ncbi:MAG: DNA starvation/stationary phase protection protein Dps [Myxococcales bacterium]|nr:DNA starvation/stationary phase protection protein Dps [Myxococcales bacterium]
MSDQPRMHDTKNDMSLETRREMAALLDATLATTLDLYGHAKQAHWNVKGPNFLTLHELFDSVASNALAWSDDLAERNVTLGGTAHGVAALVAKRSKLPNYPVEAQNAAVHVEAVATALATLAALVRGAIESADRAGDKGTSDLFTGISRAVDKDLWFVESHRG